MPRPLYPILLDVSDRPVVIIGGGKVAARKVAGLIRAGATHIRIVAPELRGDFTDPSIASNVEHVAEMYHPANLDDAKLVFAATDEPRVNDAVVRDAHERGLIVCRADTDEDAPGDFITAAEFVEGPVHVAVSAGSAALSAMIRDELQKSWQPRWTRMANFMLAHRPKLIASTKLAVQQRRAIFRTLATDEAFAVLDQQGDAALLEWIVRRHPEMSDDA